MAIIKCPECGHQVSDQAKTCPSCGVEIAGKVMKCPDCGEVVFSNQTICPNCHCPLAKPNVGQHMSNVGDSSMTMGTSSDVNNGVGVGNGVVGTASNNTVVNAGVDKTISGNNDSTKAPRKKSHSVLIVSFVVALVVVFIGFYFYKTNETRNEMEAYENAMSSSEAPVLQNYLDMYKNVAPEEHLDSVTAHLNLLKQVDTEWTDAVVNGTKSALERYMQMHPGSIHVTEAKVKIDSLDWVSASSDNSIDSYQAYLDQHQDGLHIDEAKDLLKKLGDLKVSAADKQMISQLFNDYFSSLAIKDEGGLTSTLDNILNSFLHKTNASKSDVISYMNKIHEAADITGMSFRINNDWKIDKKVVDDSEYTYSVSFSVDQKIERTDTSKETFCTYKVTANVSTNGKISDLNMKKIVQ